MRHKEGSLQNASDKSGQFKDEGHSLLFCFFLTDFFKLSLGPEFMCLNVTFYADSIRIGLARLKTRVFGLLRYFLRYFKEKRCGFTPKINTRNIVDLKANILDLG